MSRPRGGLHDVAPLPLATHEQIDRSAFARRVEDVTVNDGPGIARPADPRRVSTGH